MSLLQRIDCVIRISFFALRSKMSLPSYIIRLDYRSVEPRDFFSGSETLYYSTSKHPEADDFEEEDLLLLEDESAFGVLSGSAAKDGDTPEVEEPTEGKHDITDLDMLSILLPQNVGDEINFDPSGYWWEVKA
jgi:hypothetical protein